MYKSYLVEVPDVQEAMDEINTNKWKLISVVFIADSAQILIVCEVDERKDILKIFNKQEEQAEGEEY